MPRKISQCLNPSAARTCRWVILHCRAKFLLRLTATPDRSDAADLLALCDDNLVYECGLPTGVSRGLLSPFAYRAIRDVADYEHIPWRNGRFDTETLTRSLETARRAEQVLLEWRRMNGRARRTLGFCCTVAHAEYMSSYFRERGVDAVAVHSGQGAAPGRMRAGAAGGARTPSITCPCSCSRTIRGLIW